MATVNYAANVIDATVTTGSAKGCRTPKLPWTKAMIVSFLTIIITNGAHLTTKANVTEKWSNVLDEVFLDELFVPFIRQHYQKGKFAKFRSTDQTHQIILCLSNVFCNPGINLLL